jgi:hypothetical protein
MAEAAVAHLMTLGVDVRKGRKKEKASTAADWAAENEADWDSLLEAFAASDVPIGILNEIPPWMQESIAERLAESFGEDYWEAISETTLGNAETVLRQGLERGHSIDRMARSMREYFLDDGFRYARARSENIARTESGNALNGARKDSVRKLQEELGDDVPMKQAWLSVLGNTTRATHANLDGVPENKNGMWRLGGIEVPWPAHVDLDPAERCNCQCSLTIEFGMRESEAQRLIESYWEREGAEKSVKHGDHDQSTHGRGGGQEDDKLASSNDGQGSAGNAMRSEHVQKEKLKQMEQYASDRLDKMDAEREESANRYKKLESNELIDARTRISQNVNRLEKFGKENDLNDMQQERLGKDKERLKDANEEIRFRREYYDHMRRKEAARLGQESGKIVMDGGDIEQALGKPGDVYVEAGIKPSGGRYPHSPELFKTSDLSGAKVRHYFKLPDGRIAHPDEIHAARKRGRILVVDKIKVPNVDWVGDISKLPKV